MTIQASQQYRVSELVFRAAGAGGNPWRIDMRLRFEGPRGETLAIAAFHDGDNTWRARFTPLAAGEWSYVTECRDWAALDGLRGRLSVAPAGGDDALDRHGGLLRVAPGGRYLTYSDGTPFFWLGDTWWFCPSDLVPIDRSNRPGIGSMYRHLVATRRRQGFTVLHMAFLDSIGGTAALDFCGTRLGRPFDVGYWQTADRYILEANAAGLIPAIAIGWAQGIEECPLDDLHHLWSYVVARYGAFAVTWLVCGEYNVALHGDAPSRVEHALAVGRHIRAVDPYRRAMTIHPWWHAGDRRQAWAEPWYDMIMFQSGHLGSGKTPPAALYLDAWRSAPTRPVLEGETNYEGILKNPVGPDGIRRSAYHAMQNGCAGFTYGAHGLWYPTRDTTDRTFDNWGEPIPWWASAEQPGAAHMGIMRRAYESIDWWRTEPWPSALALDPAGPPDSAPSVRGVPDGSAAIVYFPAGWPPAAAVSLRLPARPPAGLKAEWFDPRTGARTPLPPLDRPTPADLRLPDRPDSGDWVLILMSGIAKTES